MCYLKKYTGYPCLFCGSSRATFFLLHGKFASAFLIQPLASLALIVSTFAGMLFYIFLFLKKELLLLSFSSKEKKIYPLVLLILLLLNWAYLFSL
ncbi:MAG: DUF2752 domain-containing protein [Kiritimatiellae bacterium]|nr:DUF2752 domain-containing protein [Kiritimatiellia bacterium]